MAGEEVKARSTESSSRVLTGPIREAIHSLFGISAGYKTGAAGGQKLLYGEHSQLKLLTQMTAELIEQGAGGERQKAQQREQFCLRSKLAQSTS